MILLLEGTDERSDIFSEFQFCLRQDWIDYNFVVLYIRTLKSAFPSQSLILSHLLDSLLDIFQLDEFCQPTYRFLSELGRFHEITATFS